MKETMFHDWTIDGYTAMSPDGKFRLWIANGFLYFHDRDAHYPRMTLLKGVNIWTRWLIWQEFCEERQRRTEAVLNLNK